jgi:DNA-binding MarR family transcriptional regulator
MSSLPMLNDKIIHERPRLLILTHLASTDKRALSFGELLETLQMTSGNLSVQLKTLRDAGYITITKQFKDNKPLTTVAITIDGRKALTRYIDEMQTLISFIK